MLHKNQFALVVRFSQYKASIGQFLNITNGDFQDRKLLSLIRHTWPSIYRGTTKEFLRRQHSFCSILCNYRVKYTIIHTEGFHGNFS